MQAAVYAGSAPVSSRARVTVNRNTDRSTENVS